MAELFRMPCGCSWPALGPSPYPDDPLPLLDVDVENLPSCDVTWKLLARGRTAGVFQIESFLGADVTRKLKPKHIEHLNAVCALIRPGCISGDTPVTVRAHARPGRRASYVRMKMRNLFRQFQRNHFRYEKLLVSVDEKSLLYFNNTIKNVIYSGEQEVWAVRIRTGYRNGREGKQFYNLECTDDHKLLTHDRGWVELRDIVPGERVAVANNRRENLPGGRSAGYVPYGKSFRDVCWQNYHARCVLCDWREGSLDVNHLRGNRKKDNSADNLCFFCPNHHRVFSEGNLPSEEVVAAREKFRLRNSRNIVWAEYINAESMGVKDTYDVTVEGPNHNFMAGHFLVHNCLDSLDADGVSTTDRYLKKANGAPVPSVHPAIDKLLDDTYGECLFQEQIMAIAGVVAAFTAGQRNNLRKSIGKKDQKTLADAGREFLAGVEKAGVVPADLGRQLWDMIKAAGRYSFNRSHSLSYAKTTYQTAYLKAHFPLLFYTSWLAHAREKNQKWFEETSKLVTEAKLFDVTVHPPVFAALEKHAWTDGQTVTLGLCDVKGIGLKRFDQAVAKIRAFESKYDPAGNWPWPKAVLLSSQCFNAAEMRRLIEVGAFGGDRRRKLAEHDSIRDLTQKRKKLPQQLEELGARLGWPGVADLLAAAARPEGEGGLGLDSGGKARLLRSPPSPLTDSPHFLSQWEREGLGCALTCMRLEALDLSNVTHSVRDLLTGYGGVAQVGVEVVRVKEIETKKGRAKGSPMCFATVADPTGETELVIFSEQYQESRGLLRPGNSVLVRCKKDKNRDGAVAEKLWQLA